MPQNKQSGTKTTTTSNNPFGEDEKGEAEEDRTETEKEEETTDIIKIFKSTVLKIECDFYFMTVPFFRLLYFSNFSTNSVAILGRFF